MMAAHVVSSLIPKANRVLRPIGMSFSSYYFVAQPVPDKPLMPARRNSHIEIKTIGRDDPILNTFPREAAEIQLRFEMGAVCFGAVKKGRLIGWIWTLIGAYREPEDRCIVVPCPEGFAAWDLDMYVEESQRLSTVFVRLWDEVNAYLRNRGIKWTISRVSAYNSVSLASHERLGARKLGRSWFLNIGPIQVMVASRRPYVHLSTPHTSLPVVHVYAPR